MPLNAEEAKSKSRWELLEYAVFYCKHCKTVMAPEWGHIFKPLSHGRIEKRLSFRCSNCQGKITSHDEVKTIGKEVKKLIAEGEI